MGGEGGDQPPGVPLASGQNQPYGQRPHFTVTRQGRQAWAGCGSARGCGDRESLYDGSRASAALLRVAPVLPPGAVAPPRCDK